MCGPCVLMLVYGNGQIATLYIHILLHHSQNFDCGFSGNFSHTTDDTYQLLWWRAKSCIAFATCIPYSMSFDYAFVSLCCCVAAIWGCCFFFFFFWGGGGDHHFSLCVLIKCANIFRKKNKTLLRPIIKLWLMCNFNYYINHHNCNPNARHFFSVFLSLCGSSLFAIFRFYFAINVHNTMTMCLCVLVCLYM